MGQVWLPEMPEVLAKALGPSGFKVDTYPGMLTRSRSSGGFDEIRAIGLHHDAWRWNAGTDQRARSAWETAGSRPIGSVIVDRKGDWIVGAAGATNTQGKGGPVTTTKGVIPKNAGNRYFLSVEPENDGIGQSWPTKQLRSLVIGIAALAIHTGLEARDVLAHFEWTDPGESVYKGTKRKIDPADVSGQSKYAIDNAVYPGMFDMRLFRLDVEAEMHYQRSINNGGAEKIMDFYEVKAGHPRIDTRDNKVLLKGRARYTFDIGPGVSSEATHAMVTVTAVQAEGKGYVTIVKPGAPMRGKSVLNYPHKSLMSAIANTTLISLSNRKFDILVSADCHILVEALSYAK
jgi:hypothetical protein